MILGNKAEKKIFNSCEMAIEYYKTPNKKSDASFYNNIFADNLSKSKREQSPFKELRELRELKRLFLRVMKLVKRCQLLGKRVLVLMIW